MNQRAADFSPYRLVQGRKWFPAPYPARRILRYIAGAVAIVALYRWAGLDGIWGYVGGGFAVLLFASLIFAGEKERIRYRHG